MRASFRTRIFLASIGATLLALVVAGAFFTLATRRQTNARIEATLSAQARLAAELLGQASPLLDQRDEDRKSTRLNSSHVSESRMPSSA